MKKKNIPLIPRRCLASPPPPPPRSSSPPLPIVHNFWRPFRVSTASHATSSSIRSLDARYRRHNCRRDCDETNCRFDDQFAIASRHFRVTWRKRRRRHLIATISCEPRRSRIWQYFYFFVLFFARFAEWLAKHRPAHAVFCDSKFFCRFARMRVATRFLVTRAQVAAAATVAAADRAACGRVDKAKIAGALSGGIGDSSIWLLRDDCRHLHLATSAHR